MGIGDTTVNTTNEVLVLRGLLVYRERNNKQDDTKHLIIIARRRTIREEMLGTTRACVRLTRP